MKYIDESDIDDDDDADSLLSQPHTLLALSALVVQHCVDAA
jgi:hypothetical protein